MFGPSENDKIIPIVNLEDQSVLISAETGERMSHMGKGGLPETIFDDATTIYETLRRGARVSKNGDCLGHRKKSEDGKMPYAWIKYKDVIDRSVNIARGIIEKGLKVGQETTVGIYSTNRPEWVIAEQACYVYSMVSVPLYDTLGSDACSFILQQTETRLLFVDKSSKAEKLIDKRNKDFPTLSILVVFDKPEASLIEKATTLGMEVIEFKHLEELGRRVKKPLPDKPPLPDDLATICYSSGTTGLPKGVMLTHKNILANTTARYYWNRCLTKQDDVVISYLPLAHMFARVVEQLIFLVGGRIGYYRGDIKLLGEDLQELKPTMMPTVPRLLNRIHDTVMNEVNKSYVKRSIFRLGMSRKMIEVKNHIIRNDSVWDRVVFKKIQSSLGGRLRCILTGSAPLSEEVMNFCRATMGCLVLEGYGQTECVAGAAITLEDDWEPCQVGPPIPCCKIKMADVPEMNYFAKDGCGEICIFGPHVMKGYYKNPKLTSEVLDPDGWLHTGDIGRWTKKGSLKLIDRKKNIFKLSQGEYIVPDKIENVYNHCPLVAQCFVYGESLRSKLVAVVVPDVDALMPAVRQQLGINAETLQELCQIERVKSLIFQDMQSYAQNAGLQSFEQAKAIHLHPELFSVESGLLTPTFKSKRHSLKEFFEVQIAQMYESLNYM